MKSMLRVLTSNVRVQWRTYLAQWIKGSMQKLVVIAMRPLKMVKGIIEFRFGMNMDQWYG